MNLTFPTKSEHSTTEPCRNLLIMPFELQPATLEDIPELVKVYHAAFADDKHFNACYGAVPPRVLYELDTQSFTDIFDLRWVHFFKVVDTETGCIAGWSQWEYPHTAEEARVAQEATRAKRGKENPFDIKGINRGLCCELAMQSMPVQQRYFDGGVDFNIQSLVVSPDYRRLGLASLLVKAGLDAADEAKARIYVEATPMGRQVYLKLGFEAVAELVVDLAESEGDGFVSVSCLVREAVCGS